jgi:N-acetylglucosamine repressor
MKQKLGNQQTMREINKSLLLNLLYQYGPLSRVELSRRTLLSPTTVSVLMDEAIKEGIIYESGTSGTGVGRKMTLLSIKEDNGYVLGIDLSNSPSRCVLLNMRGKVMATQPLKRLIGEESIRTQLIDMIRGFMDHQQIPLESVSWIGVSVPGRITADQEFISSTYLNVDNMPLKKILDDAFHIPVNLVNDLDAAGFAERFSGAAKGNQTIVYILIDYGIGAGLVLNNQIFRGSTGRAGMIKDYRDYDTAGLAKWLKEQFSDTFALLSEEETVQQFVRLGMNGVETYASELELIVHGIAKYCGNVLLLLNPEQLILSGWITEDEAFFQRLINVIHQYEDRTIRTPVSASHWKKYGAAVGAATLGLHQMFKMKTIE